ncbi:hypothetical protein OS493_029394 [Desmophyllum pertusum]|uniref:Tyrosinase copper-binding domain-containing protein n=1 Tax=Desmophyllum pertusum TaxID=174260 RepID=A0A9W9YWR8_9CNID|nr:hypothetical protein OS493_029394 [Desmophyllum pertusum]
MEGMQVDGPCGQKCICLDEMMEYCCRQRKNFPSMTRSERLRYVNTVIKLSTDRRYRREYNRIVGIHKRLFNKGIHTRQQFLPWHRWFLLLFENLLRKVDCRVTLPYWDWSLFSGAAFETGEDDIWSNKDWGLGGDGKRECVKDGRFSSAKKWSLELDLRANLHDTVHCRVGGTMCDHNSANAPEFFLHHAFIDKIWADWQEKSSAHRNAYFPRLPRDIRMKLAQFHPREYIDTLNMPHPKIDKFKRIPNLCGVSRSSPPAVQ